MQDNERHLIATTASTIVKLAFYICMTTAVYFLVSSYELKEDIITTCEDSCSGYGVYMESVTSRKCVCSDTLKEIKEKDDDIWILPRK